MALGENRVAPEQVAGAIHPLDAYRMLRTAGGTILSQAALHGQLAWVEWEEEKNRLLKMLVVTLLGFACLLCVMLAAGALVLACSWETGYRIAAMTILLLLYGAGTALAWRRFQALAALGAHSFAGTREELAVDLALLRSHL